MARKPKSSLGVVFWIALLIFLTLLYVANRINLPEIIGKSGLSGVLQTLFGGDYRSPPSEAPVPSAPAPETNPEPPSPPPPLPQAPVPGTPAPPPALPSPAARPAPVPQPPPAPSAQPTPPAATTPVTKPDEVTSRPEPAARPAPRTRDSVLHFVRLTDDGKVSLESVVRKIPAGSAPMTDTLNALLAGPAANEEEKGLRSLIPPGTLLLSAAVRDGIAYLSFDEHFRFNSFGIEGFRGQVRQVVFTVTEFPTITAVQILINGNRLDYLSPEGVFIGKPLGRESL